MTASVHHSQADSWSICDPCCSARVHHTPAPADPAEQARLTTRPVRLDGLRSPPGPDRRPPRNLCILASMQAIEKCDSPGAVTLSPASDMPALVHRSHQRCAPLVTPKYVSRPWRLRRFLGGCPLWTPPAQPSPRGLRAGGGVCAGQPGRRVTLVRSTEMTQQGGSTRHPPPESPQPSDTPEVRHRRSPPTFLR